MYSGGGEVRRPVAMPRWPSLVRPVFMRLVVAGRNPKLRRHVFRLTAILIVGILFGRGASALFLAVDKLLRFIARPAKVFEQLIAVFAALYCLLQTIEALIQLLFWRTTSSDRRVWFRIFPCPDLRRSNCFLRPGRPCRGWHFAAGCR